MILLPIIVTLRVNLFQLSLFSHQSKEGSFCINSLDSILPSCNRYATNCLLSVGPFSGGTDVTEELVLKCSIKTCSTNTMAGSVKTCASLLSWLWLAGGWLSGDLAWFLPPVRCSHVTKFLPTE